MDAAREQQLLSASRLGREAATFDDAAHSQPAKFKGNEQALLNYWKKRLGKGGGDFYKCLDTLSDHPEIDDPKALCAWLHHEVSGLWPSQEDK